jgi:hypothetical protein
MKKLYITLIERDNGECPNIGTITGCDNATITRNAFKALESHFDAEVTGIRIQDGMKFKDAENSPPLDATVSLNIDGDVSLHEIEIHQTWLYE